MVVVVVVYLKGGIIDYIEYVVEIVFEYYLGMICDFVYGYV